MIKGKGLLGPRASQRGEGPRGEERDDPQGSARTVGVRGGASVFEQFNVNRGQSNWIDRIGLERVDASSGETDHIEANPNAVSPYRARCTRGAYVRGCATQGAVHETADIW